MSEQILYRSCALRTRGCNDYFDISLSLFVFIYWIVDEFEGNIRIAVIHVSA